MDVHSQAAGWAIRAASFQLVSLAAAPLGQILQRDKHRQSDDSGPFPGLSNRRLRDIQSPHDFSGHLEDLLSFLPGDVRIELDAQRCGQHLRGEVFGVLTRLLVGFAVSMVFGEIAIGPAIRRNRQPDGRGHQPIPLVRLGTSHHAMRNLAGIQQFLPSFTGNDLAVRGKNRRDAYEIAIGHAGAAQGLLEGRQLFPVYPDSSGQKHMRRYHRLFSLASFTQLCGERPSAESASTLRGL